MKLALHNFAESHAVSADQQENISKLKVLTLREREVFGTLASGKISKEIADALDISVFTVEQHKKNIKKKLDLNTVGELVSFAFSVNLSTDIADQANTFKKNIVPNRNIESDDRKL